MCTHFSLIADIFLCALVWGLPRGSASSVPDRSSASEEEICRIISIEVVVEIRKAIPKMFASIMTTLIDTFKKHYVVVTEATATAATTTITAARPQAVICYGIGNSTTQRHQSLMGSKTRLLR